MSTKTQVKKSAAKKPKAAPKTASHPSYFEMIKEAILVLKEKTGSSPHAIAKYMEVKHKSSLPLNFRKVLGVQLKNSAAKGKLMKIKSSFKLSEAAKKVAAPKKKPIAKARVAKKPAVKKPVEKKPKAKVAKKKVVKKKISASAVKPKVPKSIKAPAAKRAKKAAVAKA